MREAVLWLLSENNSDMSIGLFDIWHLLYLFVILGGGILLSVIFGKKGEAVKKRITDIFAYLVIGFYIADFFLMPLSDSYNGISTDKLPFHICTLMAIFVPFAQFNKKFEKIMTAIVTLSMAGSLMWMVYPGSALGGEPPFSYRISQTFMYHGLLFNWGFLNLTFGRVKLDIKNIWKEFCGILLILLWAFIGNTIYADHNWFFIKESIFSFLPDEVMPPVVVFCVFGVCLVVYGAYYLVCRLLAHTREEIKNAAEPIEDGELLAVRK